jgi:hypothetical protein
MPNISQPGLYKPVNNLTFTGSTGTFLTITANFVTIDLAGFTISGPGKSLGRAAGTGMAAGNDTAGIALRNGTISGFTNGVDLGGDGSVVEGLRVFGIGCPPCSVRITAMGVVKGKWNKIEHRLFSFISQNWRAQPLVSYRVIHGDWNYTISPNKYPPNCVLIS